MPNWCGNSLTVTGEKKQLTKFKEFAKGDDYGTETILDFNKFIPYPKKYKEKDETNTKYEELVKKEKEKTLTIKERNELALLRIEYDETELGFGKGGYNNGGYNWCINSWGTKWNACSPEVSEGEGELCYTFDTAWSPPVPVVFAMSKKFPKLTFHLAYEESGCDFEGDYEVKAGQVFNMEERPYDRSKDGEDES